VKLLVLQMLGPKAPTLLKKIDQPNKTARMFYGEVLAAIHTE
jgi:hypothetical protein